MSKTVLIVEDNEMNMKLFNDLLQAHQYNTIQTFNGLDVEDICVKQTPDLIILDIQLPEISGMDIAKKLKEHDATKSIPIIAVTAFAMKGDEKKVMESGCDAYLSKPISVHSFIEKVESFIGEGD
jgi:two-component system cell cycle response regulator DivK